VSVTPRARALNRGHIMDADVKKAERAEARRNAPKSLAIVRGQRVFLDGGEWGMVWCSVSQVLDAHRAEVVLPHGGRLIVPRSMLSGGL